MRPPWPCSPRIGHHQVKKEGKDLAGVKSKESDLALPGSECELHHFCLCELLGELLNWSGPWFPPQKVEVSGSCEHEVSICKPLRPAPDTQ